ncbi:MAG: hypothetical protein ACOC0U_01565 [Desulfovibrionales bacterium]
MRRLILFLALVLVLGLSASHLFARGFGPGWGGHTQKWNSPAQSEEYRQFLQETVELRSSLAADQVRLRTLRSSPNPDSQKIESLTGKIEQQRAEIRKIAENHNLPFDRQGYGQGWRGQSRHGGYHGFGPGAGHGPRACW